MSSLHLELQSLHTSGPYKDVCIPLTAASSQKVKRLDADYPTSTMLKTDSIKQLRLKGSGAFVSIAISRWAKAALLKVPNPGYSGIWCSVMQTLSWTLLDCALTSVPTQY